MPNLTHKITLIPTKEQKEYFAKAAGTSRKVWNWALDEWNKQFAQGKKPNAMALKKQFNAIKYELFPWLKEIHRDAHAAPFEHLGIAWTTYFRELKRGTFRPKPGKEFNPDKGKPNFKNKGRCTDSFYVANDKFSINDRTVRLPKTGKVKMTEALRFTGKILGATVSRQADKWHIAVQVEVSNETYSLKRVKNNTNGVDLGITSAVTLSNDQTFQSPRPLKSALRRLKIRSRKLSHKFETAKVLAGFDPKKPLPKGTRLDKSNNHNKLARRIARTHVRITNIRSDFTHKLTSILCRENQTLVIEDLDVKTMQKNHRLALSISDIGFNRIRSQLEYKTKRYNTELIIADRYYPSSKTCSTCGYKVSELPLSVRNWQCPSCNTNHDRDINAAINLKRLVTKTTLPLASLSGNGSTDSEMVSVSVGKVTPVIYEYGFQSDSGQEQNLDQIHI